MKKLNYRKCVGCGTIKDKSEMIKLTIEYSSKEIYINTSSKINGRSAYICQNNECIKLSFKKDKISKSLKKKVPEELQKKIFSVLEDDIMIKH